MSDTAGAIYQLCSIAPTYLFSRRPHFVSQYNRCTLRTASSLTHFQSTFVLLNDKNLFLYWNIRHFQLSNAAFIFLHPLRHFLCTQSRYLIDRPRIKNSPNFTQIFQMFLKTFQKFSQKFPSFSKFRFLQVFSSNFFQNINPLISFCY